MRLEKLTLYGFKSFADKTEFIFEAGLTAFVGPNGCGKSNVVDAVRWALGEQRPRALRGGEMADVIFKGNSEGRRSMGYAEVTLTLLNDDHALPIEYETVAITRRLYRSGESEYLLNGQPCRLRDVRELLMDTGIGMDAYSIVEQGKIDLVLQSNPRDRRAVFEEAAGISKYNAKRRAAAAKLERVEQNLLRLGDTIQEVQKQLRSIRRQAAAARRYKEYAESLSRLRLAQSLHRYHQIVGQRCEAEGAIAASEGQQQAIGATVERLGAERTALEAESIENDQRLARVEGQCAELTAQAEAAEQAIRLNRERIRDAEAREERIRQDSQQLGLRIESARSGLEAAGRRSAELQAELAALEEDIAGTRQALQGLGAQCAELARRSEGLRTGLLDALRRRAAAQNQLASIEAECRSIESQRQRFERRRGEIARQLAELAQERGAAAQAIEGLERSVSETECRLTARAEERGELRVQVEALGEQIAELTNTLSSKTTRRDLLEDLEARFEGVELGTQTLLERQAGGQRLLHGMVADLLQVEPEYALAIEAALGGAVQHLVADTLDSAAEAVTHLKAVDGGRSTLLSLDRLSGNGRNGVEAFEHPGVVGHALSLVGFPDSVAPVVRHLLGDTLVVRDLESAVELARSPDLKARLATLTGDLVDPHGLVSGGSPRERTGLLSRKNELRALAAEIADAEARLAEARQRREHFITESTVLDAELEEARQTLNHLNLDLASAREQLSRLGDRVRDLMAEDASAASEQAELAAEFAERQARCDALAERIQEADREEEDYKARLSGLEAERQALDEQRSALERRAGDLAVRRAELTAEREHLRGSADRWRRELADAEAARLNSANELEVLAQRRAQSAAEIAAKEQEVRALLSRREEVQRGRIEAENRRAELLEKFAGVREQAQAAAARLREAEQEAQALRLRISQLELQQNDLVEKVRNDHHRDLRELHAGYEEPEVNWDELQGEMDELRRKLENMGTVNPLAIEEETQLDERLSFLTFQEQDLQKAKGSLQEVIRKVNRQSRQLFEQTFATVRENFQAIFRKLFNGGRADIVLEPGVDVLEAGVEIIAKPPGKEGNLSLLSGGEKALTAAAILLAIFKSRPSPFCILDEVDAPLDDNNIGRFVALVREFLTQSQFIMVTHSKQTMAVADVLYGITMQEPGVSTKIAVRLEDVPDSKVA